MCNVDIYTQIHTKKTLHIRIKELNADKDV